MAEEAGVPSRRQVQILQVAGCPVVDRLLALVAQCQQQAGIDVDIQVMVGQYPSPTLVVDGLDVASRWHPLRAVGSTCLAGTRCLLR